MQAILMKWIWIVNCLISSFSYRKLTNKCISVHKFTLIGDVAAANARKHILYLAGIMNGEVVMVRVRIMIDKSGQVPIEVCVRSPSLELSESLSSTL